MTTKINLYNNLSNLFSKAVGNYYISDSSGNEFSYGRSYGVSSSIVNNIYEDLQDYIHLEGLSDYLDVMYETCVFNRKRISIQIKTKYLKDENFLETFKSLLILKGYC